MTEMTLNRRRILAGTAALASPLAAVPALAATPQPDAELIALCRLCLERTDYVNTAAEKWSDDELDAACDEIHAMETQITAAVPVSIAGLVAKARIVRRTMSFEAAGKCCDTRMQLSLFENIEAMARETAHV